MSEDRHPIPQECPRCDTADLCIDNVEGMECLSCGCWFETDTEGHVIWAYLNRPTELGL